MNGTKITRQDRHGIVQPAGDVVAAQVAELRSALRGALTEGIREITLDFANVHMVDSSGLGLIMSAHNSMRKAGGRLAVIHASRDILDLFRSMRLHQHLTITGDEGEPQ